MPLVRTTKSKTGNPDDDIIFWQSDPVPLHEGYRSHVYQFTRKQMREWKISLEKDRLIFGQTEEERKEKIMSFVGKVAEALGASQDSDSL